MRKEAGGGGGETHSGVWREAGGGSREGGRAGREGRKGGREGKMTGKAKWCCGSSLFGG